MSVLHTIEGLERMPTHVADAVREVFTNQEPLGPHSADLFSDAIEAQDLVFSADTKIWEAYQIGPKIIVGRKGSGKTSILSQSGRNDSRCIQISLSSAALIRAVKGVLYKEIRDYRNIPAEDSAPIWRDCLNASIITELCGVLPSAQTKVSRAFLAGLEDEVGESFGHRMEAYRQLPLESVERFNRLSLFVEVIAAYLAPRQAFIEAALREIDEALERDGKYVAITLDSMEDYDLADIQRSNTIRGLLRCIGGYTAKLRRLRMSISAEAYFDLQDVSSNIVKDFHRCMVLHWSPIELLRVVAWRYLVFLSVSDPRELSKFKGVDLTRREHVQKVLQNFLPPSIKNRRGVEEPSIAYLARHTQLLPRQIILLLNAAMASPDFSDIPRKIDGDRLVSAIYEKQHTLYMEVFNAYRFKYPFARKLCESVLPNLRRFFGSKELEGEFRNSGRDILKKNPQFDIDDSFQDFQRVLTEIGAIGRVVDRDDAGLYADCEFEYAVPGRLVFGRTDEYCLHPLFSGANESGANRDSAYFVYPHRYLNSNDRRDLWIG